MTIKILHFHWSKILSGPKIFFYPKIFSVQNFVKYLFRKIFFSVEWFSHVDMYILLTIRFGIDFSSKPHHPPRRVYCPPRPHQCKKSLHPGSWVLHMVVALKSMSLLIGLKHIDTFSIIKNKRSKKKGKRRNKSILVNDSLNRSNSLNPDFKFIHEQRPSDMVSVTADVR